MARRLTRSQLARKLKIDRSLVTRWAKTGVLHFGIDKKVDFEEAQQSIAKNVVRRKRPKKKASPVPKSTMSPEMLNLEPSLVEAKRATELLRGELLSLKVQVERGDLIRKEEPRQWFTSAFMIVRHALLNFPRRMAPRLVSIADEREIAIILRQEMHSIMDQLARAGRNGGNGDEGRTTEKTDPEDHSASSRLGLESVSPGPVVTVP